MTSSRLSLTGDQVSSPAMIYRLISAQLETPPVPVTLTLENNELSIEARVVYASDDDDEFLLGRSFDAFDRDAAPHLRDYLLAHGGPEYVESIPG